MEWLSSADPDDEVNKGRKRAVGEGVVCTRHFHFYNKDSNKPNAAHNTKKKKNQD